MCVCVCVCVCVMCEFTFFFKFIFNCGHRHIDPKDQICKKKIVYIPSEQPNQAHFYIYIVVFYGKTDRNFDKSQNLIPLR